MLLVSAVNLNILQAIVGVADCLKIFSMLYFLTSRALVVVNYWEDKKNQLKKI